ncbi:MAG: O-antigen ligase family protein [Acidobacteria bacterium]|nr:MAG: O-antigen ligase family protein [Acidobacteriota bacterium]
MKNHKRAFAVSEELYVKRTPFSIWIWVAALLGLFGLLAMLAIEGMVSRHGVLAILALACVPAGLIMLILGLRCGLQFLHNLKPQLKWYHGLWLLVFASALVFRVRGVDDIRQNPIDAWALYRIGIELIVVAALFIRLALRRTPWLGSMFRGFVGVIAAFGVVDLASTVWSVYPTWTLYKACEYLLDIALLGAILATVQSVKEYRTLFNWTWMLYGMLLASTWFGVLLWPQQALYPSGKEVGVGVLGIRLEGVLPALSSNDVGTFAGILGLIALCRLLPIAGKKSDRAWYVLLLIASVTTMVIAQTRSAIAGFLFGIFLLLLFSGRLGLSAFLTFVVAPLLVISSLGGLVWTFLERGQSTQQLETLSSRVDWWSFAWQTFMERPLTGYGAYAAGRFAVMAKIGMGETSTMHSDYLEMIVGTGIWGITLFLLALLGTWWFLTRYLRHSTAMSIEQQMAYEALVVLGMLTLRSIFMTMLTWHPPLHYLVILGYAEFLRRRRLREIPISTHIIRDAVPQLEAIPSHT